MKKNLLFIFLSISLTATSQETAKIDTKKLLKELTDQACLCIDSIPTYNRISDSISADISSCIGDKVGAYQLGERLANVDLSNATGDKKNLNISLNFDPNSDEYKEIYYQMERYLMANCTTLKGKIAANDKENDNSMSKNKDAIKYYELGIDEGKKENFKGAIEYYKKAVKIDPNFAFAYDNMGISYRRLEKYDLAIESYEKSLKIDPKGKMPLQNIAVAYSYKKQYKKAVDTYEKLALLDPNNPEVFYGIGQMYSFHLNDYEKGLNNMCQAYNLYFEQKSPYRTDAEKIIQMIYGQMKKDGKEEKFNEILKANNISQD
jgi:tetratricopeptide (TPR) repeat protein